MKAKKQFETPQVSIMKMQPEVAVLAGSAPSVDANSVKLNSMGGWNAYEG